MVCATAQHARSVAMDTRDELDVLYHQLRRKMMCSDGGGLHKHNGAAAQNMNV